MNALDWLLKSDPSIRWQALDALTEAPRAEVAEERAKVATDGWGADLLALRRDDGLWDSGDPQTEWTSLVALILLRDMGLDPSSEVAREAIANVRDNATWHSRGHWFGTPLFAGEVEPCINGRVVAVGAYFGVDVAPVVERLVGEQMADGGWNCEQENGSTRGSFHTTINVLEGLLEHQQSAGGEGSVADALDRGHQYLLERRLLRRLSDGTPIDPEFSLFSYPTGYHYDALRAIDHLRAAGIAPDPRAAEAVELVRSKQDADGRLPLENPHEIEIVNAKTGDLGVDMGEREGEPSRWNTLRGLRVLAWYGE